MRSDWWFDRETNVGGLQRLNAFLGNPMVTTAALPLLLGIVLALLVKFVPARASAIAILIWGAVVLFLYWDTVGAPVFPPIAASQKLIYLAFAGIVVGPVFGRLTDRRAGILAAAAIVVAFAWLGWRRIAAGPADPQMMAALITGLLTAAGAAILMAARTEPSPPAERPFLVPAAVLAMSLAGAIVSVLGASIVVGQLLGSLAALVGGYCLVEYVARLRGRAAPIGWSKGLEFLMLYATATALIQVALLAPKANIVALALSPLPLIVAALLPGPLLRLLPDARPLRPLVAGLLIAIPAMLAVLTAIVWAPHGAALGFS
jgi:hypothetical protein